MLQRSELELGHSLDVAVLTQFANSLLLSTSAGESKRLIDPMLKQLCQIAAVELHPESFLDTEASHTPFGKAVSFTTAAQCAEDPERGRVFIQGIYQAIQDRLKAHPGQIVNILYAGTGPFAWLLLPLLPLFSASQIQVTLLDIHQASLDKVTKLIEHFDLADRVVESACADATLWQPNTVVKFDVILSETMKHLLQQEPQVQIFTHLQAYLADDGVLIPQNIELDAWLECRTVQDFVETHYLGPLFALNLQTARLLASGDRSFLAGTLLLPDFTPSAVTLKFTTSVQVYGNSTLSEYQSQLTLPRYRREHWLKPLSCLAFRYEQGTHPDFVFDVIEQKPVLVSSDDLSCLGIYHLQRLWQKIQLRKRGVPFTELANEWHLDKTLLDLCGIGLEPGLRALYQNDHQSAFVAYIQQIAKLTAADIAGINQQLGAIFHGLTPSVTVPEVEDFNSAEVEDSNPAAVLSESQLNFWQSEGYLVIPQVLTAEQCAATRDFIWQQLGANEQDPTTWYQPHEFMQKIMLQLFRHPQLDANRQVSKIRQVFERLWQRTDLVMTTDRVSFNPPETPTWHFPGPDMHWDMPLQLPVKFATQGLIYLTDTSAEQGAFCCVPRFHLKIEEWLLEQNKPDIELQQQDWHRWQVKPIAAKAGDLIIWHHALPHGASPNRGTLPRMVQYINFYPMAS
ncbi:MULTISPECIES: phytanoyl-CoA dioxygenase family protein [unclassified Shewanella]|uniref:phytanoyl-CoA dioxygenase family protein n=1 Tax=Shewanella TaxID=22 RepID=UPI0021DA0B8D|nr:MULTISPECIES: phytanoyl-CoA dioxygenase family protein [unclassified Shewanella]MCU8021104.1 phytanoyl-CoA dioxygenase family protein [Shewanella sp. SM78]MCU8045140.1 phytanoyl-CoA dioxygenase family protein [Shewanella sp. SM68]MCU8049425.1 phytanoyl-CoA dioxygenase family protein [Shewanella sp. SM65]MCU8078159.1 phytanoyl-CoA dioxygenase family protein [Shewanella sp. SM103]